MSLLKIYDGSAFIPIGGNFAVGTSGQALINSAGAITATDFMKFDTANNLLHGTNVKITSAGNGLFVKEGANAYMGTGILTLGATTINTTVVTASSRIFLSDEGGGILANIGALYISSKTAGSNFTVASSNATDSSTFAWLIVEPA